METQVKVRFNLYGNPVAGETAWAKAISENLFQLTSIPFYADGYALDDIVQCREIKGHREVVGIEKDSGNGTIRIYFQPSQGPYVEQILNELVSIGCKFERASPTMVAVSIPHDVELPFSQIADFLNAVDDKIMAGWEIGKRINRNVI
jgi:hypothetical protein